MAYKDPKTVVSPKASWKLIEVLRNGETDGKGDDDAALVIGSWDDDRVLAVRWNGSKNDVGGVGNPQSRGLPTWFVLPCWMNDAIVNSDVIPEPKKALVRALLDE